MTTSKSKPTGTFTDNWGEIEQGKRAPSSKERGARAAANQIAGEWSKVSAAVAQARVSPVPTSVNALLVAAANEDLKHPLGPAYLTWAADNLMMEARFEEAIEIYRNVAEKSADHPLKSTALWPYVFEQRAACHERLGEAQEAVAVYEALIKSDLKNPNLALWQFRIGQISEAAGNDELAVKAYERAAEAQGTLDHVEGNIQDLATRSAKYIKLPGETKTHAQDLANELAFALRRKDIDKLGSLASRTHFALGAAGSERHFTDTDAVLRALKSDLQDSKVSIDPTTLLGRGDKLYLPTYGWNGKLCSGMVLLLLTRRRAGWQWDGLALTQLGVGWDELHPPPEREENQRMRIRIKAPWPAGLCFRAGGVIQFGLLASAGPFAWWVASLADSCGFGIWGFYYNMVGHSGTDAFAIDFTRNIPGVPFGDAAGGTIALSVFEGIVSMTVSTLASGDPTRANRVEIDHQDPLELLFALIFRAPRPIPKHRSKYFHLAGPSMLLVSPMMMVAQGSRLGPMDDTGNSACNHLHFSMHDRDLGFGSIRPSPMDGQTLNDSESGKCICSTNVPV